MTARKPDAKVRRDYSGVPGYLDLTRKERRVFHRLSSLSAAPYTIEDFWSRRGYAGRGVDSNGIPTTVDSALRTAYRHYRNHGGSRTWESWLRRRELASLSPEGKTRVILQAKGLAK